MKKSLLKLAIAATIIGGLPSIGGKISKGGVIKKAIVQPYFYYTDYINRTEIALKSSEALKYHQPAPKDLVIDGKSEDVGKVNSKLASISFTNLGYFDKYHGVSVPADYKADCALSTYAIGLYSSLKEGEQDVYYVADTQTISDTVSFTKGESYTHEITITNTMNYKTKGFLSELDVELGYSETRSTTNYYERTVSTTFTRTFTRDKINGQDFPWCLKKFALYIPLRFEEYSVCTVSTCGLAKGSYISKVSYKLLQIENNYEIAKVYKEMSNDSIKYYFHSSQGGTPMTMEEINAYSGITTGHIHKAL